MSANKTLQRQKTNVVVVCVKHHTLYKDHICFLKTPEPKQIILKTQTTGNYEY